jgi:excisionase family DNA binding protein
VNEPLLTSRQIADYLALSANTVLDWFEAGRLPGFRLGGRKGGPVRFRLSEVEAALERWRVNGPAAGGEVSPTPTAQPALGVVYEPSPTPQRGGEHAC